MLENIYLSGLISYGLTMCPAGWTVTEHASSFHRLCYILSGEAYFINASKRVALKPGALYLFPACQKYRLHHNPLKRLHCLWLHITLNAVIKNDLIEIMPKQYKASDNLLIALKELIESYSEEYIIKAASNALISAISPAFQPFVLSDKRVEKALAYVSQNYADPQLSNARLANLLNIDTRYFIRLFKKNSGQTPHSYISNYRILRAAELLADGSSVNEVSEKVGFTDVKAFSRFFKQHYGINPSRVSKDYFMQP